MTMTADAPVLPATPAGYEEVSPRSASGLPPTPDGYEEVSRTSAPAPSDVTAKLPPTPEGYEEVMPSPPPSSSSASPRPSSSSSAFESTLAGDQRGIIQRVQDAGAAAGFGSVGGLLTHSLRDGFLPAAAIGDLSKGVAAFRTAPAPPIESLYSLASQEPSNPHFGAVAGELANRYAAARTTPEGNVVDPYGHTMTAPAIQAAQLAGKGWDAMTPEDRTSFHRLMGSGAAMHVDAPIQVDTPDKSGVVGTIAQQFAKGGLGTAESLGIISPSDPAVGAAQNTLLSANAAQYPVTSTAAHLAGGMVDPVAYLGMRGIAPALAPAIGETPGMLAAVRSGSAGRIVGAIQGSAIENAVGNTALAAAGQVAHGQFDPEGLKDAAASGSVMGPLLHTVVGGTVEALGGHAGLVERPPYDQPPSSPPAATDWAKTSTEAVAKTAAAEITRASADGRHVATGLSLADAQQAVKTDSSLRFIGTGDGKYAVVERPTAPATSPPSTPSSSPAPPQVATHAQPGELSALETSKNTATTAKLPPSPPGYDEVPPAPAPVRDAAEDPDAMRANIGPHNAESLAALTPGKVAKIANDFGIRPKGKAANIAAILDHQSAADAPSPANTPDFIPDKPANAKPGEWTADRIRENLVKEYEGQTGGLGGAVDDLRNRVQNSETGLHPDDLERMSPAEKRLFGPFVDEDGWSNKPMSGSEMETVRSGDSKAATERAALDWGRVHEDPAIKFAAWMHDNRTGGRKQTVDISTPAKVDAMLGKSWKINGQPFRVTVDDDGTPHLEDDTVAFAGADRINGGKIPIDRGSLKDDVAEGDDFKTYEPKTSSKTSGPQGSLLGDRYAGSGNGSKTTGMFGDTSTGPASELEAKGNNVGQAAKDNETAEMFDKNAIGQTGMSEGPPGPLQIGNIAKLAGVNLKQAGREAIGALRNLRERFSPIEAKYGSDVAKAFIKTVAAPSAESNTLASSFIRRAFGNDTAKAQEWTDLGRFYRLRDMQARYPGQPVGAGLPPLPPSEVARLGADPDIQRATAMYNKEIAPMINDIRTRNGMVMNSAAADPKKFPFFLNLPGEMEGPRAVDTSVNPTKAFNRAAVGNDQLKADPRESLAAAIRGHLATDYKQQLVNTLKSHYSIPESNVQPVGAGFEAKFRGRTERVTAVDLAPSDSLTNDNHYLPTPIAKHWEKIEQERGDYNTLFDKAVQLGTKVAVVGDFAPHAARVIAHTGARMAQAGMNPAGMLPSWLGSNEAAAARMYQMVRSSIGETMQLLIDRSGSDKDRGLGVKEGTTWLGQKLAVPHDILFNPDHGVDPMARRTIADAHLRILFGNEFMDRMEGNLKAGRMSSIEAARSLELKMSDAQFVGLGRKVNSTLGFANAQTRSGLLNGASRVMPFISSESGMIPREIAKMVNVDIPGMLGAVRRGAWKQLALQAGGSLATGAVGVYLAANALNYGTTMLATGRGHFMNDNDEGHKLDIYLSPGWHLSNLDPTFSRGARLTGVAGAANGKGLLQSAARENMNEIPATMAKALQIAFTAGSAMAGKTSAPRAVWDAHGNPRFQRTTMLEGLGVPVGRNTVSALARGKPVGPGIAQDAASTLLGAQLKHD